MRNKLIFLKIIIFNFLFLNSLFAQNLCEEIFNLSHILKKQEKHSDNFSMTKSKEDALIQKLSQKLNNLNNDYFIENNRLYLKISHGVKKEIGQIQIIYPKYVFEYQSESFHNYWLENGVTKADMDLIIDSRGQTFGRGYYVSLSPTDSQSFGRYLTTFQINKPMVLLRVTANEFQLFNTIRENPNVIRLLKKSGFSGLFCNQTWLSIFDESFLKNAAALDEKSLSYALQLNIDPELQRAILNESNSNLTVSQRFQYVKNANKKEFNIKKILSLNLNKMTENQKLILIDFLIRNNFEFARQLLYSRYSKNALELYANLLIPLKKKNYPLFTKILYMSQNPINYYNLGFKYEELIRRVGSNE